MLSNLEADGFWFRTMAILFGGALPLLVVGRAASAVLIGLGCLILIARFVRRCGWRDFPGLLNSTLGRLFLLLAATWIAGSFFSYDPGRSMKVVLRTLLTVWFAYELFMQFRRDPEMLSLMVRALKVSSLIPLLYVCYVGYLDIDALDLLAMIKKSVPHHRQVFKPFASVAACFIPVFLWCAAKEKGGWRALALVLTVLSAATVWYGGTNPSRSSMFGLAIALLLVLGLTLLARLPGRARLMVSIAGVAVLAAGTVTFLQNLPRALFDGMRLPEIAMPFPDMHRQVIWGEAYNLMLGNPLLGVGVDTINLLPTSGEKVVLNFGVEVQELELIPSHPHNWVLEVAAEAGLPALILVLSILFCLLAGLCRRLRDRSMRNASLAAIAVTGCFWGSSLSNFSIWSSWWLIVYFLLISCLLAVMETQKTAQ